MAGGIFMNKPFSFNMKCVVFGTLLILFYWLAAVSGRPNFWLFPLIFVVAYIAMAWYDYYYNCENKLRSGSVGLTSVADSIFKPQLRDVNLPDSAPNQEEIYRRNVNLFHLLFAMPLFMYLTYGKGGLYQLGFGLALIGFIYHLGRLFKPRTG